MGMGWLLFGGLGVLSVQGPRLGWEWRNAWPARGLASFEELRSAGMVIMFFAVLVIIAYFTNPNEASYRTFLTELTFRRHLTQLHIPGTPSKPTKSHSSSSVSVPVWKERLRRRVKGRSGDAVDSDSDLSGAADRQCRRRGLAFTNRAAVSLRTGPHAIRSYGLFSIGVVTPVLNPPQPPDCGSSASTSNAPSTPSPASSSAGSSSSSTLADELALEEVLPGLWIIGAFGSWWLGGSLADCWLRDSLSRYHKRGGSKDGKEEHARLIRVHALDRGEPVKGAPSAGPSMVLPPASHRADDLPLRPSTPPPLPKSAVLPLHTQHTPTVGHSQQETQLSPPHLSPPRPSSTGPDASGQAQLEVPASPPQPVQQDPAITQLLIEIKSSEAAVSELQSQVDQVRSTSTEAHASLSASVDQQRERKRAEEVERNALKSRTKALDEDRRRAEKGEKEAEKKLKSVQAARDGAEMKKERLEREIGELKGKVEGYMEKMEKGAEESRRKDEEVKEEVERKKGEIKSKEVEVASLSARAQGLEERIRQAEERLKMAKEEEKRKIARDKAEAVARAANAMFERQMQSQRPQQPQPHSGFPGAGTVTRIQTRPPGQPPLAAHGHSGLLERRQLTHQNHLRNVSSPPSTFTGSAAFQAANNNNSNNGAAAVNQPNRSRALSLKGLRLPSLNNAQPATTTPTPSATASAIAQRAKGYSIFDQDIAAAGNSTGAFNGFMGGDPLLRTRSLGNRNDGMDNLLSPAAASFLPSNLLMPSPRLNHEEDPFFMQQLQGMPDGRGHLRARRESQPVEGFRRDADWLAVGAQREAHRSDLSLQQISTRHLFDNAEAPSTAPAGRSSFDQYNEQRAYFAPRPSDTAPAQLGLTGNGDEDAGKMQEAVIGEVKRRWFTSKKPTLNPDAKLFTPSANPATMLSNDGGLPQRQIYSRLLPWRGASQPPLPTVFQDMPVTSSPDTPNFFSSLIAFQPSAAELKALSGNPASRSRETINSFGSSGGGVGVGGIGQDLSSPSSIYAPGLPHSHGPATFNATSSSRPVSGNGSQSSLGQSLSSTAAAAAAAWETAAAAPNTSPTAKRPFGRFWSKSKEVLNPAGSEAVTPTALGPIERPAKSGAAAEQGDADCTSSDA